MKTESGYPRDAVDLFHYLPGPIEGADGFSKRLAALLVCGNQKRVPRRGSLCCSVLQFVLHCVTTCVADTKIDRVEPAGSKPASNEEGFCEVAGTVVQFYREELHKSCSFRLGKEHSRGF